jgi:predicted DNA-binding transcriptional regulator AlpA
MRYTTRLEPPVQPRLLDVHGVAKLYSISERSVWRLCKLGRIPRPVQFGQRATRWRMADLLDHIGKLEPTAAANEDPK